MPAMSLLTPTESHAFQSFLSSIEFVAPEWNMYNEINESAIPHAATGKESLAKATKDLMSLDTTKWSNPPRPVLQSPFEGSPSHPLFQSQHQQHFYSYTKNQQHSSQHSHPQQDRSTSFHPQPNARPRVQSPSISIAPLYTVAAAASPPHPDDVPSSSSSPASVPTPASPSTPFEYYPPPPSTPSAAAAKRPSQDNPRSTTNKRPRSSIDHSASSSAPIHKPALLSPSQKKANHIQSEQKRRANIRRGYEALCETIPALREAIRLEEEACSHPNRNAAYGNGNGNGNGRSAAGSKGKKKARGRFGDDGEKVDGRAGPRSENIVLQKTIDYVQDLLIDRKDLLARLHIARNSLARGHPLLLSDGREMLWEREWTGGEHDADDEDEDDDEE